MTEQEWENTARQSFYKEHAKRPLYKQFIDRVFYGDNFELALNAYLLGARWQRGVLK